jgi:hypothetical protein
MALKDSKHAQEIDLFRLELVNIIDNRHALVQLAKRIDWQACEAKFGGLYASGVGRPGHPIRLMVDLQLLKQICNVSDEELRFEMHKAQTKKPSAAFAYQGSLFYLIVDLIVYLSENK